MPASSKLSGAPVKASGVVLEDEVVVIGLDSVPLGSVILMFGGGVVGTDVVTGVLGPHLACPLHTFGPEPPHVLEPEQMFEPKPELVGAGSQLACPLQMFGPLPEQVLDPEHVLELELVDEELPPLPPLVPPHVLEPEQTLGPELPQDEEPEQVLLADEPELVVQLAEPEQRLPSEGLLVEEDPPPPPVVPVQVLEPEHVSLLELLQLVVPEQMFPVPDEPGTLVQLDEPEQMLPAA